MIAAADQFGPWAPGLDAIERTARCRVLRAVAHLSTGPRGETLCALLRRAETEDAALDLACAELKLLAPLDFRRVLASYGAIHRPTPTATRGGGR